MINTSFRIGYHKGEGHKCPGIWEFLKKQEISFLLWSHSFSPLIKNEHIRCNKVMDLLQQWVYVLSSEKQTQVTCRVQGQHPSWPACFVLNNISAVWLISKSMRKGMNWIWFFSPEPAILSFHLQWTCMWAHIPSPSSKPSSSFSLGSHFNH